MDSIVEAFVDAGYFRARISSLSDFDKIIGGLAWAMQVFSYDININIFYADSLDLGQKIALTERLVMVILVMNCPYQIEPHQIVGLDHSNILPVVRWLIKRSAEVRREHEAFNRLLALRHFHRVTNSPMDRSRWCHIVPVEHFMRIKKSTLRGEAGDAANLASSGNEAVGEQDKMATEATSSLIEKLNEEFKDNQQVSFVKLSSLFRVAHRGQSSQFDRSQEDEADEDEDSDDDASPSGSFDTSNKLTVDDGTISETNKELGTLASKKDVGADVNLMTTTTNQEFQNEKLDLLAEKSDELAAELHKELNTELLATNQKILNLLRKLDSMPSKLEIEQYQKRYIELHQQLISKNKDVKKLYTLFNSLDSTKHYLTKEINLLDSISANFDLTANSAANRDQFLRQFQDIIAKIQSVRDDVVTKLNSTRKKCDSLNAEYTSLLN